MARRRSSKRSRPRRPPANSGGAKNRAKKPTTSRPPAATTGSDVDAGAGTTTGSDVDAGGSSGLPTSAEPATTEPPEAAPGDVASDPSDQSDPADPPATSEATAPTGESTSGEPASGHPQDDGASGAAGSTVVESKASGDPSPGAGRDVFVVPVPAASPEAVAAPAGAAGRESPAGTGATGPARARTTTSGAGVAPTDAPGSPPARAGQPGRPKGGPGAGQGQGQGPPRARLRPTQAALASLPVPPPGPSFWADLESALAEQQSVAITTRPAIRPITEPPPLSQPRLSDGLPGATGGRGKGRSSSPGLSAFELSEDPSSGGRRAVVVVAALAIIAVLLVVASVLGEEDDQVPARETTTTTSRAPNEVTTPSAGPTTTTTPQVPGLQPATPLTAAGLGPLRVGLRGRDLQDDGVELAPDQSTFQGSGGRCYDVYLPGAPDVVLRFRSGDAQGVDDPLDGVLAAVSVLAPQGSTRLTDAGLGLGATAEQVQSAHTGDVTASTHPLGQVLVVEAPDGSGNGIAYVVDGTQVAEINVGALDVIPQPQTCA